MAIQINKNEEIWRIWKKNYFKEKGRHYTAELSSHIECTGRFYIPKGINLGFRETAHLPLP